MTFAEFYERIKAKQPTLEFRERVANACGVTTNAVSRWLAGTTVPDKLKKEKISELLEIPVDVLFPDKELSNESHASES